MDTNFVHRHPGPPDTLACVTHQSYGNPTLDVSARPQVGLPPIFCEAAGYPFQGVRRLHPQQPVDGGNEGREFSTLL